MKQVHLTWLNGKPVPLDAQEFDHLSVAWKEENFWKILSQKDSLMRDRDDRAKRLAARLSQPGSGMPPNEA